MRRSNWKVLWRKRKWRIYCWGVHAILWSHHVFPLPSGLFISSSLMRFKSTLWTCALIHNIASLLTSQSQRGRIYHFLFSRTISTWHIPSHNVCTQQRAILVKCLLSFYDDDNYCHFPFTCSLNILCYSCTCDYICTDLPNIFTYTYVHNNFGNCFGFRVAYYLLRKLFLLLLLYSPTYSEMEYDFCACRIIEEDAFTD